MRRLKQLFCLVLALTFIGGFGAGAWVGTLTASAPREAAPSSIDRRVGDFQFHFELSPTQIRQLRTVLAVHDRERAKIVQIVSAQQRQQTDRLEGKSRDEIRQLLTDRQRTEYDKLVGPR